MKGVKRARSAVSLVGYLVCERDRRDLRWPARHKLDKPGSARGAGLLGTPDQGECADHQKRSQIPVARLWRYVPVAPCRRSSSASAPARSHAGSENLRKTGFGGRETVGALQCLDLRLDFLLWIFYEDRRSGSFGENSLSVSGQRCD